MGAQLSGPSGGSKFTVATNADMNVTPLVDVMLVLLIIFMVAAPLATVSIKLDLPPALPNSAKPPKPPTVISLQKSGAIFVGPRETHLETLTSDLVGALAVAHPQDETVYIRADKEVKYDAFMSVLNNLQKNGFYKVSLITEDRV
ncbi:MAG: biopolymer transporter ExbD [Caulobacteraceae bacterium]